MTAYSWQKRPSGIADLVPMGEDFTGGRQIATVRYTGGRRWKASAEWGGKSSWWLVGSPAKGRRLIEEWFHRSSWDPPLITD